MEIEEYSFVMDLDESGVIRLKDTAAVEERIMEWLSTPEGTVADRPGWGNKLGRLKFEPSGPDTNVLAEMLIAEKLVQDVKDMVLRGVLVDFKEIDRMYVVIDFGLGLFEGDIEL